MPENETVRAAGPLIPDYVIQGLADASRQFLSMHDFTKLWDRASAIRPEAHLFGTTDPGALRVAQLKALSDSGALSDFVRAWVGLRPAPEPLERAAITLYCGAAEIDLPNSNTPDAAEKQAALQKRDSFLNENDIYDLIRDYFPRVCCIVGTAQRMKDGLLDPISFSGTGCLVAPDVVLTNWHVIEPLLDDNPPNGKPSARENTHKEFAIFFDHRRKEVITAHDQDWANTKRVLPAKDWYVDGSRKSSDPADLSTAFDFALIRLATPIGKAARDGRYGEARGWIPVTRPGGAAVPQRDQALLCPQHPGGLGRVFAFGRAIQLYRNTNSRLAYSLSAERGSSGSPVLSVDGRLIALHEADGKGADPNDVLSPSEHNRGILLSAFANLAAQYLPGADEKPNAITGLWAVRSPGEPRHPLVGRQMFVDWIEDQTAPEPALPIYVITGGEKSGKSFSIDILRARLETLSDTVLAFAPTTRAVEDQGSGGRSYLLLPERPDVLLAEIAKALGLDSATIPAPPPEFQWRVTEVGQGAAEDLKLNDWASNSLTKWLDESIKSEGIDPGRRLWIVLDVPPGTPFGPGIQSFLKTAAAHTMNKEHFRGLRWIYIGYDPIFLAQTSRPHEQLRPHDDITKDDVRVFFERMYAAVSKGMPDAQEIEEQFDSIAALKAAPDAPFWKVVSVTLLRKINRHMTSVEA